MEKINITKEEAKLLKLKLKCPNPTLVVAGLIEKDGKYLLGKRTDGNELVVGKWEFPGGKVEENEGEDTAIERELKEEFGLNTKADKYVCNVLHEYPKRVINLTLWHVNVLDENIDMDIRNHSDYKWLTLDEIGEYDLAPADRELYDKMMS
jgi:mutator protein MutT